jgi:DNA-binding PadR family transcriptional regulator
VRRRGNEGGDAGQDGPQKRFRITAEGRDALAAWLRTPPDLTSPPRDELVMKVLVDPDLAPRLRRLGARR